LNFLEAHAYMTASSLRGAFRATSFNFFSTPFRRTLRDVNKSHWSRERRGRITVSEWEFWQRSERGRVWIPKVLPNSISNSRNERRCESAYHMYIKTQASGRPTPIINEGLTTVEKLSTCAMCISWKAPSNLFLYITHTMPLREMLIWHTCLILTVFRLSSPLFSLRH